MSKLLMSFGLCFCLLFCEQAVAQRRFECSYSPLQQLIRTARDESDIVKLINNHVDLNVKQKCGGTVLQLAVLRGNASIVKVLLESGNLPLNENVSLEDFPILGAPKEIPMVFFAAYYSPRADIMRLFISAGADILTQDSRGGDILWYLNQNPVLSNTDLSDEITQKLLMKDIVKSQQEIESVPNSNKDGKRELVQNGKNVSESKIKRKSKSSEAADVEAPQKTSKKKASKKRQKQVVSTEPDRPFKPGKEDANAAVLNQSDF